MLPSLSSQHLGAVSLCRGAAHASSAHWLGCRQEDLGGGCCWCPTAQLPLPALGAGVRGPGAVYFDFQENSTLWGASSAVSWPAGLPRGGGLWLGGWCRLHMTSAKPCVSIFSPAQGRGQSCRGSPHWYVCSPGFVPLLLPRALHSHPGPAQPSRGGGRGCDTARDISAPRGCGTSSGQQRGFCFHTGCAATKAFCHRASSCPASLRCARRAMELQGAASWGPCRPPFELGTLQTLL